MTFTQTIDIPADRRITLEIPREMPTGRVNVIIQFPDAQPKTERKKIGMTRKELDEFLKSTHTPIADSLLGILKTDMTTDEIRMARLAKHL